MIRKIRLYILIVFALIAAAGCIFLVQQGIATSTVRPFIWDPLFTGGQAALVNSIVFALFCLAFVVSVISGRSNLKAVAGKTLKIVCAGAICWGIGFFGLAFIPGEFRYYIFSTLAFIEIGTFVALYMRNRKRAGDASASSSIRKSAAASGMTKYAYSVLYGALTALVVSDIVFFAVSYPECTNQSLLSVLAVVTASLIVWRVIRWRGILLFTFVTIVLCGVLQIYTISVSPDTLGFTLMSVILYSTVAVPVCDLYCRKEAAL